MTRKEFLKKFTGFFAILIGGSVIKPFKIFAEAFSSEIDDFEYILSLALSKGGDISEIFIENTLSRNYTIRNGVFETLRISQDEGCGIRVIKDDKYGYAYTQNLSKDSLIETAKIAGEIAEARGVAGVKFSKKEKSTEHNVLPFKIPLDEVPDDEKIKILKEIHESAFSFSNKIKTVSVGYSETIRRIKVVNSEGIHIIDLQPVFVIRAGVVVEENGQRASGRKRQGKNGGFELLKEINPSEFAKRAVEQAEAILKAKEAPAGEMPIVIEKGWGGVLFHEAVGHGLEGDAVSENASYYSGKMGQVVASPLVTLVDDGTLRNARGSFNFDDEGTPSQYTVLIDKGKLIMFMTDIMNAKKLGLERTGNGRRESYRYPPLVRMRNTYILPGDAEPGDVIKSTSKGIYCKDFGGGQVDTTSGNFTFSVTEAYMIEKGEITYPLKGVTIIGNGPEALKNIDMVAKDFGYGPGTCGKGQWVPVTSGQPTLRIKKITVGGQR